MGSGYFTGYSCDDVRYSPFLSDVCSVLQFFLARKYASIVIPK